MVWKIMEEGRILGSTHIENSGMNDLANFWETASTSIGPTVRIDLGVSRVTIDSTPSRCIAPSEFEN